VVLFAGRLSKEKGVAELVTILKSIRRAVPRCIAAVVGDGPLREQLQRDMPDVFFSGWVDEEILAKMYAAADVFLFPSRFDTFGNVVLEAHACGLPVVAYNTKGPRDIIVHDKTGCLVESRQEMADAAASLLLDTQKRYNFRQNALLRAAEFNAPDIVEKMALVLGLSRPRHADASIENAPASVRLC
jgi:glycosyltransferase involved in cell wall biosynthesis